MLYNNYVTGFVALICTGGAGEASWNPLLRFLPTRDERSLPSKQLAHTWCAARGFQSGPLTAV